MANLSRYLKEYRAQHNMSQHEFARQTKHFKQDDISKLERGLIVEPNYKNMWILAQTVGLTLDQFIHEVHKLPNPKKTELNEEKYDAENTRQSSSNK